ncbi:hypothetical protein GCM10011608_10620 [Micromonospora sonchi]|uniref:Uncharacterized protein n=1 Tax=Micromonospora sonchi TaxID=1763543 RepID=A0A917TLI8_9ACTN|nr:hypothetical protein [Micromonospora sonchi]GGM27690.1 hypothetical protein GCM10011608_10620 [Micromonospora sonchi]
MTDPKPMTGPEHVKEALRLADLADQKEHALPGGNGYYTPTDAQRDRWLMRAHLHANLARTAAMVDTRRFNDGTQIRSRSDEQAWHEVFAAGGGR